ncbi:hypothetical protein ACFZCP_14210 [Streptomyces sp. NPDC007971]
MNDENDGKRLLPSPEVRVKQFRVWLKHLGWTLIVVWALVAWWRI